MTDALATVEHTAPRASRTGQVGRRIVTSPLLMMGAVGLTLIVAAAVLAPLIAPYEPTEQNLANILAPPIWSEGGTSEHLLGSDVLGRDTATRLLYGARNSLFVAFFAMLLGSTLGLVTGLVAGFFGGRVDSVLMRLGDVQLAFPFILLAIAILGVASDRSPLLLIAVLGIPGWIVYARVVRSRVIAEKEKDYVSAAFALGAGPWRRLFRYVFPSVWQVVPVIAFLDVGFLIIMESTLSFLGLGLPPPAATWGGILADGRRNMVIAPWLPILPGLAIVVTVLCINLVGDGLAAAFDTRRFKSGFRRLRSVARSAPIVDTEDRPLLAVRNLRVDFPVPGGTVKAVRGIDFDLDPGETLGVVGESGSGKSVTAAAVIGLLDPPGQVTSGAVVFDGEDLTGASARRLAELRGRRIAMIFQNPAVSLNPVLTIGFQLREAIRHVTDTDRRSARDTARRLLTAVGIGDPDRILGQYPFQLSGGMNQRVMIAMALAARPRLLLADEPTTALDTTTQAQILDRLVELTDAEGISLVLITHDIALVSEYADKMLVLYAGEVCEYGPVREIISRPRHPYTRALLESVPRVEDPATRLQVIPGELPDPQQDRVGCPFAARCPEVMDICRQITPPRYDIAPGHIAACYLWAPETADAVTT